MLGFNSKKSNGSKNGPLIDMQQVVKKYNGYPMLHLGLLMFIPFGEALLEMLMLKLITSNPSKFLANGTGYLNNH